MVKFLQPIQVKALLLDPQRRDNILILDVRDDDFAGGHIKCTHFLNVPSYDLSTTPAIDHFIEQKIPSTVDTVIVHCYLSQQRGPTAARRYIAHLFAIHNGFPATLRASHCTLNRYSAITYLLTMTYHVHTYSLRVGYMSGYCS
jgi:Cdc25 family phosphatase